MSAVDRLRQAARRPIGWLPDDTEVRILSGPLRGRRWLVGSHVHSCWLGTYEKPKPMLFHDTLRPGDVVYDIGANVGYYSLIAASRVGASGAVIACEPVPRNLDYLRVHVHRNGFANVTIVQAAAAASSGRATFATDAHPSMGRLSSDGELEVETIAIDDLLEHHRPPDVVKMDVEGGELLALSGAARTLAESRPVIFLATHGAVVHDACLRLLEEADYVLESLADADDRGEVIARPREARSGS